MKRDRQPSDRTVRGARMRRTDDLLHRAAHRPPPQRDALLAEAITLNLPVATSIAHQYRGRGVATDDLEQVASLGLVKAVRRFDPDRGQEFLSFAVPTISGEIKRHFRDLAWSVRPPRRIQDLQAAITPTISELTQEFGRFPRPSEIAARLDVPEGQVGEALACGGCFAPMSLEDRGPAGDGYEVGERLGKEEHGYRHAEAVAILGPACRSLKQRDRRILYLRFYLGWTQDQIAQDLGVTQMQVSRLLSRILRDLRRSINGGQLARPA